MSSADIEKARQALQEALARLEPSTEVSNLTVEQLDLMIVAAVAAELDRRKKERSARLWTFVQRVGLVIAPLAGLTVIGRSCLG